MAKIYAKQVRDGKRTLEQVPLRWREKTAAILAGDK